MTDYVRDGGGRTYSDPRPVLDVPGAIAAWVVAQRPDLTTQMHEDVLLVCLDSGLRPVGELVLVGVGGPSSSSFSIPRILRAVLLAGAPLFVLVHNHPSGCIDLSASDRRSAAALKKAAEVVELGMLDFLAVGRGGAWGSLP